MDLDKLRHALAVDECRSFTAAAARVNLTASAISRSVQALEAESGLILFERRRGGVLATAGGRVLLEHARGLLASAEVMERELRQLSAAEAREAAFGIGPVPAAIYLSGFLSRMRDSAPHTHLEIEVERGATLRTRLVNGQIAFFLCADGSFTPDDDFEYRPLGGFEVGFLVRAEHPLALAERPSQDEIARYPMVGSGFYNLRSHGSSIEQTRNVGLAVSCDDFHSLMEYTASSDAVCIAPRTGDPRFHNRYGLRFLETLVEPVRDARFVLITRRSRPLSFAARVAADELLRTVEAASLATEVA